MSSITTSEILKSARKELAVYALIRPETISIIALTGVSAAFSASDILFSRAWLPGIAVIGAGAVAVLCVSTLRDSALLGRISSRLFYKRFVSDSTRTPELSRNINKALDFHRDVFETIRARPNAPLGAVAVAMDEWVIGVANVARRLDTFIRQPHIVERLKQLADISGGELFGSDEARRELVVAAEPMDRGFEGNDYDLFSGAKDAVLCATRELEGSLMAMYHMQQKLKAAHPTELNRAFAEDLQRIMRDHMIRLNEAGAQVESLFSACEYLGVRDNSVGIAQVKMMTNEAA
jgi:hypothetical protein